MFDRELLKEHFFKTLIKISSMRRATNVNFHFSHYKSMATLSYHSNQSSYPIETKTQLFIPPAYSCCIRNLVKIGFTASEKSFENVDADR